MEITNLNIPEYVNQMALVLNLQLDSEYRDGVTANFERILAIATVVNEFVLPDDIEAASIFEP